jgi:hypothetical protein
MDPTLTAFSGWLRTIGEDVLALANLLETPAPPAPVQRASAESLQYLLRAADLIPEGLEDLGYLEVAFAFRAISRRALDDARNAPHESASGDTEPAGDMTPEPELHSFETAELEGADAERPPAAESAEPAEAELQPVETLGTESAASETQAWETEGRVPRLAADVELIADFLGDDLGLFYAAVFNPAATTRGGLTAAELLDSPEPRSVTLDEARRWVERHHGLELAEGKEELVKIRSFFRTRLRRGE